MGRAAALVSPLPAASFAALGHQESWSQIASIVRALRPSEATPLTDTDVREIVPWIPPRTVCRLSIAAAPGARAIRGIYIDTFITPDELALRPTRLVLDKVRDGIRAAEREGVRVATLGGFTSILLECMAVSVATRIPLTTGNTLTAALIVRGVERALRLLGRSLADETLLIVGATGDIGSACARILVGRTRRLLLVARHQDRLQREADALRRSGPVEIATDVRGVLARASLVIAVASTPQAAFELGQCAPTAIVCDAGYPKNIRPPSGTVDERRLFWGGMGTLAGGFRSEDGILERFYRFPLANAAHGCMLEGMVLAMSGRFESFSRGRGRITPDRVGEMWSLATRCGVSTAPLFNAAGLWPEERAP